MCSPSKYINDICTECHPRDYVKTLAEFADKVEVIELIGGGEGETFNQYLYECCGCGLNSWVDECWVRSNTAK